ncbi:hypothetical protein RIF29_36698 [Crotalaria pallida]|uniref:Uncharacterized protein n=1 Tax=Crotalaria pallida TaxID=3830 RepID=A0AAN9EDM6_CROPI
MKFVGGETVALSRVYDYFWKKQFQSGFMVSAVNPIWFSCCRCCWLVVAAGWRRIRRSSGSARFSLALGKDSSGSAYYRLYTNFSTQLERCILTSATSNEG